VPENNSTVEYNYLVHYRFKQFVPELIYEYSCEMIEDYSYFTRNVLNHPIFRNYANIVANNKYLNPEIAECIYLNTQECVAIIKTVWIKLIQRKWKNILNARLTKKQHPNALKYRELTGKWPFDCLHYPSLKGMLANLKT
jgi:hypothetical protein